MGKRRHSPETRRKISESMRGNLNRLQHGKRSKTLAALRPVRCGPETCSIWSGCSQRVSEPGSICPMNEEFMSLANQMAQVTGSDEVYNHEALVDAAISFWSLRSIRYQRALYAEQVLDGGDLNPDVTRLGNSLADFLFKIGKLIGLGDRGPLVDMRQIHVNVQANAQQAVDGMSDADHLKALEALVNIRKLGGGDALVGALLAGDEDV